METYLVKCSGDCGGVLRHYQEMAPGVWAHAQGDPDIELHDGLNVIRCVRCSKLNEVTQPEVKGLLRVIRVLD